MASMGMVTKETKQAMALTENEKGYNKGLMKHGLSIGGCMVYALCCRHGLVHWTKGPHVWTRSQGILYSIDYWFFQSSSQILKLPSWSGLTCIL